MIENESKMAGVARSYSRMVAALRTPSADDTPAQAAAIVNAVLAAWRCRAVLAALLADGRYALASRAGDVHLDARLPDVHRHRGEGTRRVPAPGDPVGTAPDDLATLGADLATFRSIFSRAVADAEAHDAASAAVFAAMQPGGEYRRRRRGLVNAHYAQAELRAWAARRYTDCDGDAPATHAILGISDSWGLARRCPQIVAGRYAPAARVPAWKTLPTWNPTGTPRDVRLDPRQLRRTLSARVRARIVAGTLPGYVRPRDAVSVGDGTQQLYAAETAVSMFRVDRCDTRAARTVRVLLRRGDANRRHGQHSGPVFVPTGPLEVWRVVDGVTLHRVPAVWHGQTGLPCWVIVWGACDGLDADGAPWAVTADVYHATATQTDADVLAAVTRRLGSIRDQQRYAARDRQSAAERAASLRVQTARTLRAARALTSITPADSHRAGNCQPGTSAFIRALGLAGASAPGRTVAAAWRRAGYPDRDRFAAALAAARA